MACNDCPYWGSSAGACVRKYMTWMDCNYIVGELEPRLFDCRSIEGHGFKLPFDPHDFKYFKFDANFLKWYKGVAKQDKKKGVRVHTVRGQDSTFVQDENGNVHSKVVPVQLYYFQTHRDFSCRRETT